MNKEEIYKLFKIIIKGAAKAEIDTLYYNYKIHFETLTDTKEYLKPEKLIKHLSPTLIIHDEEKIKDLLFTYTKLALHFYQEDYYLSDVADQKKASNGCPFFVMGKCYI